MFKKSLALAAIVGFSAIGLPAHAAAPIAPITNPDSATTNFIAPETINVLDNDELGDGAVSSFRLVTEFGDVAAGKQLPADGFTAIALNSSGGSIMITPSGNAVKDSVSYAFDLTDVDGQVIAMTGTLEVVIAANGVPTNPTLPMRTTTMIDGYGSLTFDSLNRTTTFVSFSGTTEKADGTVACLPSLSFLEGCLVAGSGSWSFAAEDELPVAEVEKPVVDVAEKPAVKAEEASKPVTTEANAPAAKPTTVETLTAAPRVDKPADEPALISGETGTQERSGGLAPAPREAVKLEAPKPAVDTKAVTTEMVAKDSVKTNVSKSAPVKVAAVSGTEAEKTTVHVAKKAAAPEVVRSTVLKKSAADQPKAPAVSEVLVTDTERTAASTELSGTQKESMSVGSIVIGFVIGAVVAGLALLGIRTARPKN